MSGRNSSQADMQPKTVKANIVKGPANTSNTVLTLCIETKFDECSVAMLKFLQFYVVINYRFHCVPTLSFILPGWNY